MNIFSSLLIFYIFYLIIKSAKKKSKETADTSDSKTTAYGKQSRAYQNTYADTKNTASASQMLPRTPPSPRQAGKEAVRTAETTEKTAEKTTVEYLADKAEKIEQGQQLQEKESNHAYQTSASANGTRAAERIIEGVSVPQDRRPIKCHYCGADNMVPTASHEVFTCYFCREVL